MERKRAIRSLSAATVAGVGLAVALILGAPWLAALLALLAGIAALALLPGSASELANTPAPAGEAEDPQLPGLAELLRAVDEPMLIVRERRVLAANVAAKELLGAHIVGTDVRLALRHPAAAEKLAGPTVEGEEARTRIELVGLGGADRQWTMTVTRLPDGSRLVRLGDLSQTRAAEQMRVDFVANASHELRTPLATLLGFLETLQDEDAAGDPATRERFLKIMFGEAKRMRGLVDDLMSLSRIEAERFAVPADPVDLLPLIDETRTSLRQLFDERGSMLVLENDAGEAIVTGDRPQLAQMLANLLVNSLKYGRAGAPIRINLDNAGSELIRLGVTDQGEGIAPEHIPRLTERFYRVDPGRSRSVGGTGLGLAIVKHIVLRHRGRLDIRSKLGEGTSVHVYLPRARDGEA